MRFNRTLRTLLLVAAYASMELPAKAQDGRIALTPPVASSQTLESGDATLQINFSHNSPLDLTRPQIFPWILRALQAVDTYYGRFPVPKAQILIVPVGGEHGVLQGTTWGNTSGLPGLTRILLGQHTTEKELTEDWTLTHELVHMAFPSLPHNQHWMEEGLATYIEPVARVQNGELQATQIWADMLDRMPKGQPNSGDKGLNRTHTWGRTYWGGAMFCLVADVNIRKQTGNRKGLQDALRAIVAAGGTIDHEWALTQALATGDKATGTTVLTDLYRQWGASPVAVDLPALWAQLGIRKNEGSVEFLDDAPLAAIRKSITAPPLEATPSSPR